MKAVLTHSCQRGFAATRAKSSSGSTGAASSDFNIKHPHRGPSHCHSPSQPALFARDISISSPTHPAPQAAKSHACLQAEDIYTLNVYINTLIDFPGVSRYQDLSSLMAFIDCGGVYSHGSIHSDPARGIQSIPIY